MSINQNFTKLMTLQFSTRFWTMINSADKMITLWQTCFHLPIPPPPPPSPPLQPRHSLGLPAATAIQLGSPPPTPPPSPPPPLQRMADLVLEDSEVYCVICFCFLVPSLSLFLLWHRLRQHHVQKYLCGCGRVYKHIRSVSR
jgi:hypothetical protein